MQFSAGCRSGLQCVAVCCSVLQCVAVCHGVLQCVAVCFMELNVLGRITCRAAFEGPQRSICVRF